MIKVSVNRQSAVCYKSATEYITTGQVGQEIVFEFSEAWDGFSKTAVFKGSGVKKDALLVSDRCEIPPECLTVPGDVLTVGVYGVKGDKVTPTIYCIIDRIKAGADPSGEESEGATPELWQQAIDAAGQANQKAQELLDMAARGEFDGPQGEPGPKGEQGDKGADGAKGDKGDKGDTGPAGPQGEKGDKGDKGETGAAGKDGAKGDKGDKGDAFTYSDFTTEQLAALKGEKGDKGDKGETGEPGKDGADGKDGAAGKDGVPCTHSWDGTVLTITSASGTSSADLKGPPGDSGGQEEAVTEILLYEDLVVGGFEQDETGVFAATVPIALPLVVGTKYKVIWDGTEYICECYDEIIIEGVGTAPGLFLGNSAIMVDGANESDEPFIVIVSNDSTTAITTDSGASHTVSLYERQEAPKLPMITAEDNDKFLCVVNGEPAWVAMTDVSKEGA